MIRFIILAVCFFAAVGPVCSLYGEESCPPTFKGQYRNGEYGYALAIPQGFKGEWNSPCTLDQENRCICIGSHGLTIELEPGAYLDFFAGFAVAPERPSLPDVLRFSLKNLGPPAPDDITVRIRFLRKTRLAGRPAYHFAADYEVKDEDYSEERIVSLNARRDVEYAVTLKAPSKRFALLQPHFRTLVGSWRWIPEAWTRDHSKKGAGKIRDRR
jgi:hypothetical protein